MSWIVNLLRVLVPSLLLAMVLVKLLLRRPFHLKRLHPSYWITTARKMKLKDWVKLFTIPIVVAIVSIFISKGISELFAQAEIQTISSPSEFPVTAVQEAVGEEHPWVPLLMVTVLPIFEEWIFRGILIDEIMSWRKSKLLAVSLSTIVFAVFHLSNPGTLPAYAVALIPGGFLLGICYLHTGLSGAILAHDLYNAYIYLVMI